MGFSLRHLPFPRRIFPGDLDMLSYGETFLPTREWSSFFYLLSDIYRDVCHDLGIIDIADEAS